MFTQPSQKENKTKKNNNNNNNQHNKKSNICCSFKKQSTNWTAESQREKQQQHNEILSNHNHHTRITTYTRPHANTTNRQEEQPKHLKHASIHPNGSRISDQILAELIYEMHHVTIATENLRKPFDQILKLNKIILET